VPHGKSRDGEEEARGSPPPGPGEKAICPRARELPLPGRRNSIPNQVEADEKVRRWRWPTEFNVGEDGKECH